MMTRRPSMSTSVLPCDASMGRKYGYSPAALAILSSLNAGHLSKTSRMNRSPPSRDLGKEAGSRGQTLYGRRRGASSKPEVTKTEERRLLRPQIRGEQSMAHFHRNEQDMAHS